MVFETFFLLCDSETDLWLFYRNLNFEIKVDKNEGFP